MHQTLVIVGLSALLFALLSINFAIALRSLRHAFYYSSVIILALSVFLSTLLYERFAIRLRANAFAEEFIAAKPQDVLISKGLTLRSVFKSGNIIAYEYVANNATPLPTLADAVTNNCRELQTRLLLEKGFIIEHRFLIDGGRRRILTIRLDFC